MFHANLELTELWMFTACLQWKCSKRLVDDYPNWSNNNSQYYWYGSACMMFITILLQRNIPEGPMTHVRLQSMLQSQKQRTHLW